jgi:hypothetical protein
MGTESAEVSSKVPIRRAVTLYIRVGITDMIIGQQLRYSTSAKDDGTLIDLHDSVANGVKREVCDRMQV